MVVLMVAFVFCGVGLKGCEKKAKAAEAVIAEEPVKIPEVQEEIIEVEPSNEHVWIPGYWEREAGRWVWVKGRWEKPPHRRAHWITARKAAAQQAIRLPSKKPSTQHTLQGAESP